MLPSDQPDKATEVLPRCSAHQQLSRRIKLRSVNHHGRCVLRDEEALHVGAIVVERVRPATTDEPSWNTEQSAHTDVAHLRRAGRGESVARQRLSAKRSQKHCQSDTFTVSEVPQKHNMLQICRFYLALSLKKLSVTGLN